MISRSKILIVEDERDIADLVALHLGREKYSATVVGDGESAVSSLQREDYDLVILDWMLPNISGLEVAKQLRAFSGRAATTPILMLTARSHSTDIVEGLENGADDFLIKPFELSVLLARVKALLRRSAFAEMPEGSVYRIDELTVDLDACEVSCSKTPVQLTASELRLLGALVRARGKVLTRDRLIENVQGEGVNVIARTIDTHVFGLRKKLGNCADVIETIRGVGYRVRAE